MIKKIKKQKGISLVEILVAVAIIGLLSAVVSVNLSSVKEKARINKGKQFYKGVKGTLETNVKAYLNFENTSGGQTSDISGNGNDANVYGASTTTGIEGSALNFDGSNDYVDFNTNSLFESSQENTTISLWVKPTNATPSQNQTILYHGRNGEFLIGYDQNRQFFLSYNEENSGWNTIRSKPVLADKWYHISINFVVGSRAELLVDGTMENTSNTSNQLSSATQSPMIGASNQTGSPLNFFEGIIDEVSIYRWE